MVEPRGTLRPAVFWGWARYLFFDSYLPEDTRHPGQLCLSVQEGSAPGRTSYEDICAKNTEYLYKYSISILSNTTK